jgi:hypothetical protein
MIDSILLKYDLYLTPLSLYLVLLLLPVLLSVRFSNRGTSLSALFDSNTNQADIKGSSFACSLLFDFLGVAGTSCSWTSPSLVTISPGSGNPIDVGKSITLLDSKVKAFCLNPLSVSSQIPCTSYSYFKTTVKKVF